MSDPEDKKPAEVPEGAAKPQAAPAQLRAAPPQMAPWPSGPESDQPSTKAASAPKTLPKARDTSATRQKRSAQRKAEQTELALQRLRTRVGHFSDAEREGFEALLRLLAKRNPPESRTPPPLSEASAQLDPDAALGLLSLLRRFERNAPDKPRIGDSQRVREEPVALGQDPYLAFPDNDLARVDLTGPRPSVRAQFLGMFGPYGPLPLNTTEEVYRWFDAGDPAYVHFTDILVTRFQQLFFRAWSDAQAITQFDHPDGNRFTDYLLSLVGTGTPAFRNRDRLDDSVRASLTALGMGRVKSPVRLRQILERILGADVEIEEHVASWMEFEPDSLSRLGQAGATLGKDTHLGQRIQSIGEKIRIHLRAPDLETYRSFLPGQTGHARLHDLTYWYLGDVFEVEVALWLPGDSVAPAVLGESTELGWMASMGAPSKANKANKARSGGSTEFIKAATFLLEPALNREPGSRAA